MGKVLRPIYGQGPVNAGERRLFDFLEVKLPDDYYIVTNGAYLCPTGAVSTQCVEFDAIVIAPHAIYHIENKDWTGRLEGDDLLWYINSNRCNNPIRSATNKSKYLHSALAKKNPEWGRAFISTVVTLSNKQQSKFGLDPKSESYKVTFVLDHNLIDFLTDPGRLSGHKSHNAIADLQKPIADYLTGAASCSQHRRTEVLGMRIDETSYEDGYVAYSCTSPGPFARKFSVREYQLDRDGMSDRQREMFKKQVENARNAQDKMGACRYILPTEFSTSEDGCFFYAKTSFSDEQSLRVVAHKRSFTEHEKFHIISDVAKALDFAHSYCVFHRAVSPDNIFILPDGGASLANFDFSWFPEHSDAQYTVADDLAGVKESPYTAPEIAVNDLSASSDIFSLGVVAYELFVGKLPFESTSFFCAGMGGVLPQELLPSAIVPGLPKWVDTLVSKAVVDSPDKRWASAREFLDFLKEHLAPAGPERGHQDLQSVCLPASTVVYLKDLKPGDRISNDLVLYDEIGHGTFGRVFKAKHVFNEKYFAVKLFDRDTPFEAAKCEYDALANLQHPNIVKYEYNGISHQGLFYTLMELLEGENLGGYVSGNKSMPVRFVFLLARQMLSALVEMQSRTPPIFHRDIKPQNIVWDRGERFVLIDFNISATVDNHSIAGTKPFVAPDLMTDGGKMTWDESADTFSLGVTLYQLLTHALPWQGCGNAPKMSEKPTDIRVYNNGISDAFADFVMRAIITDRDKRFACAKDMLSALTSIGEDGLLPAPQPKQLPKRHATDVDIVDYVNSLYSQSRHGNGGTRASVRSGAASALDDATYVTTKLDKILLPDIKSLNYRLVIITGNAGDGKTAFIRKVEREGERLKPLATNNGSEFFINGVRFLTNYDGSQDEDDKVNNDVLLEFFSPFFGLSDFNKAAEGRIIAINEGRLVDFLSQQPKLKVLRDNIEDFSYDSGDTRLLPGLMVINLNKRSVTARADGGSLVARQVAALTAPELWGKCASCPVAGKCFIKYNVDTFADRASGHEVVGRLEWLLRIVVYRREMHITMRDLRSLIAFMLTRDYSCNEVKRLVMWNEEAKMPWLYWQYYYFNVTAPPVEPPLHSGFDLPPLDSSDRLVKLLRDTDVAEVAVPPADRDLFFKRLAETDYLVFDSRGLSMISQFNDVRQYCRHVVDAESVIHKSLIRHQYFEGADTDGCSSFKRRLPFRHMPEFCDKLSQADPDAFAALKLSLAKAISASEGCNSDYLTDGYMMLANTHVNDPVSKSFRRFPLCEFELFVNDAGGLMQYVEYENDSFTFRHKADSFIRLTITLELFDMLMYIQNGFSPSVNDLRGRFIELQVFKNLLESKSYSEILVTNNYKKYSVISIDKDRNILIKSLEEPAEARLAQHKQGGRL